MKPRKFAFEASSYKVYFIVVCNELKEFDFFSLHFAE